MKIENVNNEKKLAALEAVKYVQNGMIVGLGTGSTSAYMIEKLGEEVSNGLDIQGVPSSERSAALAEEYGIPLVSLNEVVELDITIDGADEFDPGLQLIKGGGGALLREKILAHNSKMNIIIADSGKAVSKLGKFKLPIEIIPFAANSIIAELHKMGLKPELRKNREGEFRTDENNLIVDVDIWDHEDLTQLNLDLLNIPGVVETGLFLKTTDILIMGKDKEVVTYKSQ
ncbi:ribose-5-phosphate isomerase RpiA [Poritiphilus flavus]|uniref:Ribose-5-phosphate isomerase A n=1 Tax=Poritiphilus flavus TaxID=2697053 RepID=A0A6L9EFL4_9FLAO|nr:ribose-5-phosphate isomerase RpiA [Poritiphilus flavus]NAS13298.1 ribose-5-phosphate isomerase RpiA [Poritiphilus flavus]